ncbi:hypothetical protein [Streptomyces sp. BK79]|uniref:hypothetical protein n=1 Tax=Streptomyces sp. BK79 TaxID=3350097 RepID=UPI00376F62AC
MSAGTGGRDGLFVDGIRRGRTEGPGDGVAEDGVAEDGVAEDGAAEGGTRRAVAVGAVPGVVGGSAAVMFSDLRPSSPPSPSPSPSGSPSAGGSAPGAPSAPLPRARTAARPEAPDRRAKRRSAKIAQRIVPDDLQPEVLRLELTELGDAFRAYQRRPEPDLALLAGLHDRKARAFTAWAAATGDASLREEADRAAAAARTTREMNANRLGLTVDGEGPVVQRLLTRGQGAHARGVLEYVRVHAPLPGAEARLAVLMLALRAARAGTGNVTGQDLGGWLQGDAERVLQELVDVGWLLLPDEVTVADALDSRPEEPTQVTVPSLLPAERRPLSFGKVTRARLSGWAQRVVGDRKLRKKKAGAATRLLAVYTAAHSRPDGGLGERGEGAGDDGLDLGAVASFCGLRPEDVAGHAGPLVAADWLAEADTAGGRLRGRLGERVLPLSGLL